MENQVRRLKHKDIMPGLIIKYKPKIFAEIGVWKSHLMTKVLKNKQCFDIIKEYWTIDPWDLLDVRHGHMSTFKREDWDRLYYKCCSYMPYFPQLKPLRMRSDKAFGIFKKRRYFDFVFIDGSHFYEDVLKDIKCWYPLVKDGGILAGHDYGTGSRKRHDVKRAVDEFFGKNNVELLVDGVWIKHIERKK